MRHALATCLLAAGCAVTPPSPSEDAASLVAAERAFAAQSMRTDMATAFLANFADDGVLLANGWATARSALGGQPAPPINLDWSPEHVEVAGSGELGLSTGPWVRTRRETPAGAASHGHFVSVWRRHSGGRWKVEVDIGIPHPEATPVTLDVETILPGTRPAEGDTLERAEAAFVEKSLRSGTRAAYEAHALPRFLLYRAGHAPFRGRAVALASPGMGDTPTLWLADARVVSVSNDFGYVRGTYADAANPAQVRGYFLRVWRHESGRWGIALDVTNAAR